MRAAIVCSGLVVLVACGGAAPAAAKPAQPAPRVATKRVPIEDSELPEENVQIINARGRMEPAAVSAGIDPHAAELSACYMTRVGKRKWLGGHVALHWDIRADGQVTSVKLAESDLGAHEIERCLLDVAKAAKFTKPIGGDADFALPLSFNAPGSAKGGAQVWDEDKGLRAIGGQLAKLGVLGGRQTADLFFDGADAGHLADAGGDTPEKQIAGDVEGAGGDVALIGVRLHGIGPGKALGEETGYLGVDLLVGLE